MEEEIPFEVNRWGSCQYSGALWYFDKFTYLRKEHTLAETLLLMHSKATWDYVAEFEHVKEKFIEHLKECTEVYKDEEEEALYADCLDDISVIYEEEGPYVDAFFNILRNQAYDLWSAAPLIAHMTVYNLEIEVPKAPGIGPEWNVIAQSDNFRTGLCCALLTEFGFIKDPDEAFGGFDT